MIYGDEGYLYRLWYVSSCENSYVTFSFTKYKKKWNNFYETKYYICISTKYLWKIVITKITCLYRHFLTNHHEKEIGLIETLFTIINLWLLFNILVFVMTKIALFCYFCCFWNGFYIFSACCNNGFNYIRRGLFYGRSISLSNVGRLPWRLATFIFKSHYK